MSVNAPRDNRLDVYLPTTPELDQMNPALFNELSNIYRAIKGLQAQLGEQGTWTPANGNLVIVGTPAYSGTYIKIGKQVTVVGKITAVTSITGTAGQYITGLPFPVAAGVNDALGSGTNVGFTATFDVLAAVGTTRLYVTPFAATTQINFSCTYITT